MRPSRLLILLTALVCLPVTSTIARDGTANYSFAVFVGTGKYKINDRDIYVFRVPLEFMLKEADYENKTIGYTLLVPAAVGVTDYEKLGDIPDLNINDLQTGSVVPGLEALIPITSNWRISPFGQVGLGWDTESSNNALVWGLGARTRAWFRDGQMWLVGGEVLWAGNNPKDDDDDKSQFSRLAVGGEYKLQTNWRPLGDRRISWHFRAIGRLYTNDLDFPAPPRKESIESTMEVGISIGIDKPINILGYKFRQGGIGYEWSENLKGIRFFTTFPF